MAIQKELWTSKIAEVLFPDNAFFRNAINDSAFIEGHAVHVPQAGAINAATRDRSTIPASVSQRADADLLYLLHEYTTDPILVRNVEEVEASYDKLASVTAQMGRQLLTSVGDWTAYEWAPTSNIVPTSGAARAAYMSTQVGNRKSLTFSDILEAMSILNVQNVPMEGRKILIDGYLYKDLLKMPEFTSAPQLMSGILTNGAVGTIAGAEVFVRTPALVYDVANAPKAPGATAAADDNLGMLIWHPDFVRFALGEVMVFADNNSAAYYGSVVSALVRSGATKGYSTEIGVVAIVEAPAV